MEKWSDAVMFQNRDQKSGQGVVIMKSCNSNYSSTYNVSNIFTCIYLCTTMPLATSLLSNEGRVEKERNWVSSFAPLRSYLHRDPQNVEAGRDLRHHLIQSLLHGWGNWWSGFWEGRDRMPLSYALVKTNNLGSVGVRNKDTVLW